MINKQGLWFLTLFSLVLVLGVYYVTMPNEIFESKNFVSDNSASSDNDNEKDATKDGSVTKDDSDSKNTENVNKENTSYVETLKIELDSERAEILDTLNKVINDKSKSSEEKNTAYEQMKEINTIKGLEDSLEKKIKDEYSLNAYVKQDDNKIEVVIESDEHDVELANKIMRIIQNEYDEGMSISIKFS
ncbi:MAG: SpoIIIAH-like family protein [bacterium]|nr:SpoIIIAH-like family protein [bacterium]